MKDYLILHMKKYKKWNLTETARQNNCDGRKQMQKYSSLTLEEYQQHHMKLYQDDDAMQIKIITLLKNI